MNDQIHTSHCVNGNGILLMQREGGSLWLLPVSPLLLCVIPCYSRRLFRLQKLLLRECRGPQWKESLPNLILQTIQLGILWVQAKVYLYFRCTQWRSWICLFFPILAANMITFIDTFLYLYFLTVLYGTIRWYIPELEQMH